MLKISCLLAIFGVVMGWPSAHHINPAFQELAEGDDLAVSINTRDTQVLVPTFYLHTRERPHGVVLNQGNLELVKASKNVKFLVHDWQQNRQEAYIIKMVELFLIKADVNVVVVDWSVFSTGVDYNSAAGSVNWVGKVVGDLIVAMIKERKMVPDQMYMIGQGLGAHASGLAGQKVQSVVNGKLMRITGLDVAARSFMGKPRDQRLSEDDAFFVDVIHSNDNTQFGGYGFAEPLGSVDFFPNGGKIQPGCPTPRHPDSNDDSNNDSKDDSNDDSSEETNAKTKPVPLGACNHYRATDYYLESMTCATNFVARKSDSWEDFLNKKWSASGVMGESASHTMRGTYYLNTNSLRPFARGSDTTPIMAQQE